MLMYFLGYAFLKQDHVRSTFPLLKGRSSCDNKDLIIILWLIVLRHGTIISEVVIAKKIQE